MNKSIRAVFVLLVCSAVPTQIYAQDTSHVVIAATTDIHGRAYHWDYFNDREAPWGLTRVATVVDSLRRSYPGQVVLIDAGDLIQGNPYAGYYAEVKSNEPNRVVDALNAVQYDVATVGNHDFDYGYDYLREALANAAYPVVSANVYRMPRDTFAFLPEVLLTRDGVRIGVTGLTTPGVNIWSAEELGGQAYVRRIVPSAERAMRRLQNARAALRIVAVHSGMGSPSTYDTTGIGGENVASQLAHMSVKPHVVIVGHSHSRIDQLEINGVYFVQPAPWAQSLAVAHVWMVRDENGSIRIARVESGEISVREAEPHPALVRRLGRHHMEVRDWVSGDLASLRGEWMATYGRAEDTPIVDFINEVQRRAANADISATPVINHLTQFGPGGVSMQQIAEVYPHENTLKAVLIDAGTLREYLEHSASYYRMYGENGSIVNPNMRPYDFDIISGIEYAMDLTQPVGSRIRQITMNGRLLEPSDILRLALSSHRQSGGGGYSMLARLPVVYDKGENIRDLLIDFARNARVLRTEDYFERSWSIVPPTAQNAARTAVETTVATVVEEEDVVIDSVETIFTVRDTVVPDAPPPPEPTIAELKFVANRSPGEHALGRLVADARRNGARAHFSIVMNEAIGADLPAGPIIHSDLLSLLPDNLSLVKVSMKGETLEQLMEQMLALGEPNAHISGFEVWYDLDRDEGDRIRRMRFPDGRDVRGNQTYIVAVSSMMLEGAGFEIFENLSSEDVALTDVAALEAYLPRLRQPVELPPEARFHPEG
ncbi:MAG: 5'-nucleotidase C-terminal domain-containing protein [Myxococcota bacterium]|nr:5'-nucleotidase C-terminal domain-containing protein [Myxococcota bacterium]